MLTLNENDVNSSVKISIETVIKNFSNNFDSESMFILNESFDKIFFHALLSEEMEGIQKRRNQDYESIIGTSADLKFLINKISWLIQYGKSFQMKEAIKEIVKYSCGCDSDFVKNKDRFFDTLFFSALTRDDSPIDGDMSDIHYTGKRIKELNQQLINIFRTHSETEELKDLAGTYTTK